MLTISCRNYYGRRLCIWHCVSCIRISAAHPGAGGKWPLRRDSKTAYMSSNQEEVISIQNSGPQKLVDKFTYPGSSISSTESDVNIGLTNAWTTIDALLIMKKSDLFDKIKRDSFKAVLVSVLLYGCTTSTLTKRAGKKLHRYCTGMLRAILNKSGKQHLTKQQLLGHLPPITKTIQIRRRRHTRHCWRNKDKLKSNVLIWTLLMDVPVLADQQELTYYRSVRARDVVWKTCPERWITETDGKRESVGEIWASSVT